MLDLGVSLAVGSRTVCFVEREIPACEVLVARMQDGLLDDAPIWSDLTTFNAKSWRGRVDIVAGGIPCQPFSAAGKRRGNKDLRALAPHVLRIVEDCSPSVVFIENVPLWVSQGHARLALQGLHNLGYEVAEPLFIRASDFGAPHRRERVFVMAYRDGWRLKGIRQSAADIARRNDADRGDKGMAHPASVRRQGYADIRGIQGQPDSSIGNVGNTDMQHPRQPRTSESEQCPTWPPSPSADWTGIPDTLWPAKAEPRVRRMADGHSSRVDRLRACGNGVVPVVVAYAFQTLASSLGVFSTEEC